MVLRQSPELCGGFAARLAETPGRPSIFVSTVVVVVVVAVLEVEVFFVSY